MIRISSPYKVHKQILGDHMVVYLKLEINSSDMNIRIYDKID